MASREALAVGPKGIRGQCGSAIGGRSHGGRVASGDVAGYGTLDRARGLGCPERSIRTPDILQPGPLRRRAFDLRPGVVRLHGAAYAVGRATRCDAVTAAGAPAFERAVARLADATRAALPV